jgi:hypothetical protein
LVVPKSMPMILLMMFASLFRYFGVRTLGPKLSLMPLCKFSVLLSSLVTP